MDRGEQTAPGNGGVASRPDRPKSPRLRGLLIALIGASVVTTAAWLLPRPSGYGTHRQLGLPSCSFLVRRGYPCPGCGMTTAFAAMAHGQVGQALRAQPFGTLLFAAVVVLTAMGAVEALSGRDVLGRFCPKIWWLWIWWLLAAVAAWGLGWAVKVALGVAEGQYPLDR